DAALRGDVRQLAGELGVGLAGVAIADEVDPHEQAHPADVADRLVTARELAETGDQPLPRDPGMLLETLLVDDVEDGETDRRRHGVPTARVEVLHPAGARLGNRPRRHDGAQRMAVADRLAHRDDVRPRARRAEGP